MQFFLTFFATIKCLLDPMGQLCVLLIGAFKRIFCVVELTEHVTYLVETVIVQLLLAGWRVCVL